MDRGRWLIVLFVAVVGLFWASGAVMAQDAPTGDTTPLVEIADETDSNIVDTLEDRSPFEMWQILSGLIVSGFVIPLVQKRRWDDETRKLVALIVAAVVALIGSYFRGELDNFSYTSSAVLKVALTVYGAYVTVWKAKFLSSIPQTLEKVPLTGR